MRACHLKRGHLELSQFKGAPPKKKKKAEEPVEKRGGQEEERSGAAAGGGDGKRGRGGHTHREDAVMRPVAMATSRAGLCRAQMYIVPRERRRDGK